MIYKTERYYKNWFRKFLTDNSNFLSCIIKYNESYEDLKQAVEALSAIFDNEIYMLDKISSGDDEKFFESISEQEQYYKDLAESYEKTINKLTKAISEQEQIRWERDIAIQQLQELGYGLGEKMKQEPKMESEG